MKYFFWFEIFLIIMVDIGKIEFLVVGSAALVSGVTRTLSTSVILFELTGQANFLIPSMIATTVALAVGNMFTDSIYDTLATLKGLPILSPIKNIR